jgi:bacteriorhodopsin
MSVRPYYQNNDDSVNDDEVNIINNQVKNNEVRSITKYSKNTMNLTFYITYCFLLTTATITFIEAMRTKDIRIRNVLNLETVISIIASYFYSQFINKIDKYEKEGGVPDFKELNLNRYTDWMITTPIMLTVLLLAILYNTGGKLHLSKWVIVLILNFGMLISGYLGERKKLNKTKGQIIGFIFFFLLFGYIYYEFLYRKYHFDNQLIYWAFFIFWIFYGIAYQKDEEEKNVWFNILDLISKCFVGIFFWAYFTGVFILK